MVPSEAGEGWARTARSFGAAAEASAAASSERAAIMRATRVVTVTAHVAVVDASCGRIAVLSRIGALWGLAQGADAADRPKVGGAVRADREAGVVVVSGDPHGGRNREDGLA